MYGRIIRSAWDLLRPSRPSKDQFTPYMKKERTFKQGGFVWVRNYRSAVCWITGETSDILGPRNYKITTQVAIW